MTEPIEPDDLAAWTRELAPQPDDNGVVTYTPEPTPDEPETVGDSAPGEPSQDDSVELPQDLEAARKLRSEAANLRKRNRELEADNERLITQAAATQRREIERTAAEVLVDPTDVWRVDPELQQSFYDTEFGEISSDHVIAAAKQLAQSKPHLARPNAERPPTDRPLESLRGGASPEPKRTEVTWSSALHRSI